MNTKLDTKHPVLLDTQNTLIRLLASSLHHKHFHQSLDYMRCVLNMKYALVGPSNIYVLHARQVPSSQLCSIYLSKVSDISNHPLIIRVWITLDRFTLRFAEALEKGGDFFSLPQNQGRYLDIVPFLYTGSLSGRGSPITIWSENARTSIY